MLVFRNPGLIDLEAVRTLGVSVKREGSFGRFGTGLKFAIATILRGGGEIRLFRGLDQHVISTVDREVCGQDGQVVIFKVVTLDDVPMGITTQLGRDWEPWMVLRELGCNALDEHGSFGTTSATKPEDFLEPAPMEAMTTIVVLWDELETAYRQRKELFLEGEPIWESAQLRILSGPSAHIFYRGVRVLKLEKPSIFTYDILSEQSLTEDRTLAGSWRVDGIIRDAFLGIQEKELVTQAVTAGTNYHETSIDFTSPGWGVKPSKAFLDGTLVARENSTLTSDSARKVLMKHKRDSTETMSTHGSYTRMVTDGFTYALEQLGTIGVKFTEAQYFVKVDELPGEDMLSMVENGRIYVLAELEHKTARVIATELLMRWVELNVSGYNLEDAVRLLAPVILKACPAFAQDEQLVKEDSEFDLALKAMIAPELHVQ